MSGHISIEFTFWCGLRDCEYWEQFGGPKKKFAIEDAKKRGWKKTKNHGWVCPECASGKRIFYDSKGIFLEYPKDRL